MGLDTAPNVTGVHIGSVDPTGSPQYFVFKVPAACRARAVKVYVTTATARVKAAANNNTFTLNRIRAASATAIGSQTTDSDVATSVALSADVPYEILLTSAALSELAAGDVLQLVCTEGAAAQDLTEVACFVEWVAGSGSGM